MKLETLIIVLAGGEGTRLYPLTHDRSKPAAPFGAKYRLIDVPLSNAFNSQMRNVLVLTQGKDDSLNRHIKNTWQSDPKTNAFVETTSPQILGDVYEGDADAVRQVRRQIKQFNPKNVLVVPGDHVLKMNYSTFINMMLATNSDAAIAAIRQKAIPKYTSQLGALDIDANNRVIKLEEKNGNTTLRVRDDPEQFYASMGIYGFRTETLLDALDLSGNGFGKNILPQMISGTRILGYDYVTHNAIPQSERKLENGYQVAFENLRSSDSEYWKDVGTIEQYFLAQMDFVSSNPKFNLYNPLWPFFTYNPEDGPAKFITGPVNAILGAGAIMTKIDGSDVILSTGAYADNSRLEEVIAFDHADIQRCSIKRTIIDKITKLRGMTIGYDEQADIAAGIWVDKESGVRVVPKEYNSSDQKSVDFWRRKFDEKRNLLEK